MSEWQECKLGEIYLYVNRGISPKYVENNGISVINQKCIRNGVISNEFLKYHSKDKKHTEEKILIKGDILINSTGVGTAGRVGIFQKNDVFLADSHVTVLRIDKKSAIPEFIFYNLRGREDEIENYAEGSTGQVELGREKIKDIDIFLPPLPEQKAIANILSSLDDKIDLLHRQNKTLEAMAETLFRQWFIEEASEDWEETPLSQIANFLNGLACQKHPPKNAIDKLPVLKIKELNSGISESSDWATSEIKPEYIIENGDVIFAWSASLMVKVWNGEKCILNQHLFKVTSTEYPKWFYLMWCKHHLDEFISISSSHATTMGHIKRSDLDAAMVLVPSDDELTIMSEKMTPILNKQIGIAKQIKTLEKLRDNLLPKLMSGEVRVRLEEVLA